MGVPFNGTTGLGRLALLQQPSREIEQLHPLHERSQDQITRKMHHLSTQDHQDLPQPEYRHLQPSLSLIPQSYLLCAVQQKELNPGSVQSTIDHFEKRTQDLLDPA